MRREAHPVEAKLPKGCTFSQREKDEEMAEYCKSGIQVKQRAPEGIGVDMTLGLRDAAANEEEKVG